MNLLRGLRGRRDRSSQSLGDAAVAAITGPVHIGPLHCPRYSPLSVPFPETPDGQRLARLWDHYLESDPANAQALFHEFASELVSQNLVTPEPGTSDLVTYDPESSRSVELPVPVSLGVLHFATLEIQAAQALARSESPEPAENGFTRGLQLESVLRVLCILSRHVNNRAVMHQHGVLAIAVKALALYVQRLNLTAQEIRSADQEQHGQVAGSLTSVQSGLVLCLEFLAFMTDPHFAWRTRALSVEPDDSVIHEDYVQKGAGAVDPPVVFLLNNRCLETLIEATTVYLRHMRVLPASSHTVRVWRSLLLHILGTVIADGPQHTRAQEIMFSAGGLHLLVKIIGRPHKDRLRDHESMRVEFAHQLLTVQLLREAIDDNAQNLHRISELGGLERLLDFTLWTADTFSTGGHCSPVDPLDIPESLCPVVSAEDADPKAGQYAVLLQGLTSDNIRGSLRKVYHQDSTARASNASLPPVSIERVHSPELEELFQALLSLCVSSKTSVAMTTPPSGLSPTPFLSISGSGQDFPEIPPISAADMPAAGPGATIPAASSASASASAVSAAAAAAAAATAATTSAGADSLDEDLGYISKGFNVSGPVNQRLLQLVLDLFNPDVRQIKDNQAARLAIRTSRPELQTCVLDLLWRLLTTCDSKHCLSILYAYNVYDVLFGEFFYFAEPAPLSVDADPRLHRYVANQFRSIRQFVLQLVKFLATTAALSNVEECRKLVRILEANFRNVPITVEIGEALLVILRANRQVTQRALVELDALPVFSRIIEHHLRLQRLMNWSDDEEVPEARRKSTLSAIGSSFRRLGSSIKGSSKSTTSTTSSTSSLKDSPGAGAVAGPAFLTTTSPRTAATQDLPWPYELFRKSKYIGLALVDQLLSSRTAQQYALSKFPALEVLFSLVLISEHSGFALYHITSVMRSAPENDPATTNLFAKYCELFPSAQRLAIPLPLIIDLLSSVRKIVEPPERRHQGSFREVGAFVKIPSLLTVLEGDDVRTATLQVLETIGSLLVGSPDNKRHLQSDVGYDQIRKLILEVSDPPSSEVMHQVLDLLVEGRFDLRDSFEISNPDAVELFLGLLRHCEPALQIDLFSEFTQAVSKSTLNKAHCCRRSLISNVLAWIDDAKDTMPADLLDCAIRLVGILGTHSITVSELRGVLRLLKSRPGDFRPPYTTQFLRALRLMTHKQGPDVFLAFDGRSQGFAIPAIKQWPQSKGYSFSTWLRVDSFDDPNAKPNYQPRVFSFLTEAGVGLELFFDRNVLNLAVNLRQGVHTCALTDYRFEEQRWYSIHLTHSAGKFSQQPELRLFVNGRLRGKASLKYPAVTEPLVNCMLGSNHEVHGSQVYRSSTLFGQMGAVFFYEEVLSSAFVEATWQSTRSSRPSPMAGVGTVLSSAGAAGSEAGAGSVGGGSVITAGSGSGFGSPGLDLGDNPSAAVFDENDPHAAAAAAHYTQGRGSQQMMSEDEVAATVAKIFLSYSGIAYEGGHTVGALSREDVMAPGKTAVCVTHNIKDILQCLGGIQVLLPLIAQLDQPTAPTAADKDKSKSIDYAVDPYLNAEILGLLGDILVGHPANQEEMIALQGFGLVGYLLQRVSPHHVTVDTARAILQLERTVADSLFPTLPVQLLRHLFLDFRLWVFASFETQADVLRLLCDMASRFPGKMRAVASVQYFLDAMHACYWFDASPQSFGVDAIRHPVTGEIVGSRPDTNELSVLRNTMHAFIRSLILQDGDLDGATLPQGAGAAAAGGAADSLQAGASGAGSQLAPSDAAVQADVQALVAFVVSVSDTRQVVDTLQSLVRLIDDGGLRIASLLATTGGVDPFIGMLAHPDEAVRLLCLQIMLKLFALVPALRRRARLDTDYGFAMVTQLLSQFPLTQETYGLLLALLLEDSQDLSGRAHRRQMFLGGGDEGGPSSGPGSLVGSPTLAARSAGSSLLASSSVPTATSPAAPRRAGAAFGGGDADPSPFKNVAVMASIFGLLRGASPSFGRTVLQDVVFFLKHRPDNRQIFLRQLNWQQWLLNLWALRKNPGEGSADAAASDVPLLVEVFRVLLMHCIRTEKNGWHKVEETLLFVAELQQPDAELFSPEQIARKILTALVTAAKRSIRPLLGGGAGGASGGRDAAGQGATDGPPAVGGGSASSEVWKSTELNSKSSVAMENLLQVINLCDEFVFMRTVAASSPSVGGGDGGDGGADGSGTGGGGGGDDLAPVPVTMPEGSSSGLLSGISARLSRNRSRSAAMQGMLAGPGPEDTELVDGMLDLLQGLPLVGAAAFNAFEKSVLRSGTGHVPLALALLEQQMHRKDMADTGSLRRLAEILEKLFVRDSKQDQSVKKTRLPLVIESLLARVRRPARPGAASAQDVAEIVLPVLRSLLATYKVGKDSLLRKVVPAFDTVANSAQLVECVTGPWSEALAENAGAITRMRGEEYQDLILRMRQRRDKTRSKLFDRLEKDAQVAATHVKKAGVEIDALVEFLRTQERSRVARIHALQLSHRRAMVRSWRRVLRRMTNQRGPWVAADAPSETSPSVHWKLDKTEDPLRRRRRLKRNFNFDQHVDASKRRRGGGGAGSEKEAQPAAEAEGAPKDPATKDLLSGIKLAAFSGGEGADPALLAGEEDETREDGASDSGAADEDRNVFRQECSLVTPMHVLPGTLEITPSHIVFLISLDELDELDDAAGGGRGLTDAKPQSSRKQEAKDRRWEMSALSEVHLRRYKLQKSALEFFFDDQTNCFFNFPKNKRVKVYNKVLSVRPPALLYYDTRAPSEIIKRSNLTQLWQKHQITNFEYLMRLNTIAGRTFNDLSQYPVFPWVIKDYSSKQLDLTKGETYRDMSKPIGALNAERLAKLKERWQHMMDGETEPYLYGSHYSTAAIVLNYLIRLEPFTTLYLKLQGGKFDHPERLFKSIPETFANCLTDWQDVKELIPEFFYMPEFLTNRDHFDLGRLQDGSVVDHVGLPAWATSPEEFITINRMALESDYVSAHLNEWIDLIFGCKQRGQAAVDADNVFFYLTYEGAIDFDRITDPVERQSKEDQINEFGQTPSQLFSKPHPVRHPRRGSRSVFARLAQQPSLVGNGATIPAPVRGARTTSTAGADRAPTATAGTGDVSPVIAPASVAEAMGLESDSGFGTSGPSATADVVAKYQLALERPGAGGSDGTKSRSVVFLGIEHTVSTGLLGGSGEERLVVVHGDEALAHYGWQPATPNPAARTPFTLETTGSERQSTNQSGRMRRLALGLAQDVRLNCSLFALSPDGSKLWSCGYWDYSMRCFEVSTGRELQRMSRHQDVVTCVAVGGRADRKGSGTLVTGSKDTTVMVWPLTTAYRLMSTRPKFVLYGHDDEVSCVTVSVELDLVVSGSRDGTCILHALRTGHYLRTLAHPASKPVDLVSVSASAATVFVYSHADLVQYLFGINGDLRAHADCHQRISCMIQSTDQTHLLTGGEKGLLTIRSASTLQPIYRAALDRQRAIRSAVMTRHDSHILLGTEDGQIVVLTGADGTGDGGGTGGGDDDDGTAVDAAGSSGRLRKATSLSVPSTSLRRTRTPA